MKPFGLIHTRCFGCTFCGELLAGQRYFPHGSKAVCTKLECHEKMQQEVLFLDTAYEYKL